MRVQPFVGLLLVLGIATTGALLSCRDPGLPAQVSLSEGGQANLVVCPRGCQFSTIQSAIDAAHLGQTISVEAGTYEEALLISKPINLVGQSRSDVILRPGDSETGISVKEPSGTQQAFFVNVMNLSIIGGKTSLDLTLRTGGSVFIQHAVIEDGSVGINAVGASPISPAVLGVSDTSIEPFPRTAHGGGIGMQLLGFERVRVEKSKIVGQTVAMLFGSGISAQLSALTIEDGMNGMVTTGEVTDHASTYLDNQSVGIQLNAGASVDLVNDRFAGNGWGIALWEPDCFPPAKATFTGRITGHGNRFSYNHRGPLCPTDYPWPADFRMPANEP